MNEEVKKIYDYCVTNEEIHNTIAESIKGDALKAVYAQAATAYWSVKSFIEVNFIEK